jgi:hypothetical protein
MNYEPIPNVDGWVSYRWRDNKLRARRDYGEGYFTAAYLDGEVLKVGGHHMRAHAVPFEVIAYLKENDHR